MWAVSQKELDEKEVSPVLSQEIQHPVHELGWLAVAQSLYQEKLAGSLASES